MEVNRGTATRQDVVCEFFEFVCNIITGSPDKSCWMTGANIARNIKRRAKDVNAAKWQLVYEGKLILEELPNGKRKNPRHRLTLPTGNSINSILKVADRGPRDRSTDQAQRLVGFDLWHELPKLDLIDCYLKSGWNICPLAQREKKPIFTRDRWSNWKCKHKIDFFSNNPDLGVGMWLDSSLTVFDFDSDRAVPCETLISKRGDHSHAFFEGHAEIYNLSKINQAADFDGDIDTKARGGLVVLPPTVHESGQRYEWQNLVAPAPVPESLLQLWRSRRSGKPTGFHLRDLPNVIIQGGRNNTLWAYGRHLKASGASYDVIAAELVAVNAGQCRPPLHAREVDRLIDHVWSHPNRPHWM